MKPLISPSELLHQAEPARLILIDARSGTDIKQEFLKQHLKGAIHMHLEDHLSKVAEDPSIGGRHPLPLPEHFGMLLGKSGISPDSHIVIYDDKSGANAAARLWWMLKAAGHEKVQVLDGGMQAALKAGFPVSSGTPAFPRETQYMIQKWSLPMATISQVKQAATQHQQLLIDVREPERYNGISEPIDLIAGHIPGAINIPFAFNLDDNGFFLSPEKLNTLYKELIEKYNSATIIVHCGSGVTACHTLLAMQHAGLPLPALYVGSFSEWSRNDLPVVTAGF